MTINDVTIGENINKFRRVKGMELYDLAQASGVDELKLKRAEAGKVRLSIEELSFIASKLQTTIPTLMHPTEDNKNGTK